MSLPKTLAAAIGLWLSVAIAAAEPAPTAAPAKETSMKMPDAVRFGADTLLPADERRSFARAVNFSPADASAVALNPPRFRWQYHPSVPGQGGDFVFTFQVASDESFQSCVLDVETRFNFYNTIAPFKSPGPWYWRVGYREPADKSPQSWSRTRTFSISPGAVVWDRSALAEPDFASRPHPRILFTKETLPRLRELVKSDPDSSIVFRNMVKAADRTLEADWWKNFPANDIDPGDVWFITMLSEMTNVAFVCKVTGDDKYAGVIPRAVTVARYTIGGRSSPQHSGGEASEDSTQSSEFLGLLFDWLYEDMTDAERRDFAASLDWRIDVFVNTFAWRQKQADGLPLVGDGSLSAQGGSHPFEGFWDTFPATLAVYEESPAAREAFHLGVNYFVGVGSAHGYEEAWNEGPGYGNSKWFWQVNSLAYLDSVFPHFAAGRNPWLSRMGEFFRAVTPVGLKHAPWGHGSNRSSYYENGHRRSYRMLAFLTGDGRFPANWAHYGSLDGELSRPWVECSLPLWREKPAPVVDEDPIRLYPVDGWVTALSGPPSDPATYEKGVGMIMACRARGGYSHSFLCDNSFHVFAYGHDITHAAGTSDYTSYSFHSMSHNTILVDGMGQGSPYGDLETSVFARPVAFGRSGDVAYWCADATFAYPQKPFNPRYWWGALSDIYSKRDLSCLTRVNRHVLFVHNRYFVILDDLEAEKPVQWTWLYHVLKADRFTLYADTGSMEYRMGGVDVKVVHLAGAGELDAVDLRGLEAYRNPLTGEDYTDARETAQDPRDIVAEHNLWLTTREKHAKWRFISVIYPVAPGMPPPKIESLGELTLRVTAGEDTETITFDPAVPDADISVDLSAIAPTGLH